jgi:hypothetical protein
VKLTGGQNQAQSSSATTVKIDSTQCSTAAEVESVLRALKLGKAWNVVVFCRATRIKIITFLMRLIMPDDKTLATILAICDLIEHNGSGVEAAVKAYERALKNVIEYRRSKGITEVGGLSA